MHVRRTQTCNTQQCWKLLNNNVASVCTGLCTLDFFYNKKKNAYKSDCVGRTVVRMLSGITRQARVCEDEYAGDRCVYRSVYVFLYSDTSISRASR